MKTLKDIARIGLSGFVTHWLPSPAMDPNQLKVFKHLKSETSCLLSPGTYLIFAIWCWLIFTLSRDGTLSEKIHKSCVPCFEWWYDLVQVFFCNVVVFSYFFATVIWPWHNTSIFKFQLWLLLFTLPLSTLHLFNVLTSHSLHWNCNHFCSTLNCNSGGSWGALTFSMLEAMLQRWTWPSWHLVMPPSYVSHTSGADYCRLVIARLLSLNCIFFQPMVHLVCGGHS